MDDASLAARARDGDQRALTELVDRYHGICWRYAYRMLDDVDDAEDAVQETFLRLHGALAKYEERQQFRSWLMQVLVNQCRMAARSRDRHRRRFVRDSIALSTAAAPAHTVADDALRKAVASLDDKAREAILLRYGEGLGYDEMKQVTGVEVSALKMRVKRACERLRTLLTVGASDE